MFQLKELRQKANLSARSAAAACGVPYGTWKHWEQGERTPNPIIQKEIIKRLESLGSVSLLEITGQESGIIIFDGDKIIVANWLCCGKDELPTLFSTYGVIIPYNLKIVVMSSESTDNIKDYLPDGDFDVLYDYNDDLTSIITGDVVSGTVYFLRCGTDEPHNITVIAPSGWC